MQQREYDIDYQNEKFPTSNASWNVLEAACKNRAKLVLSYGGGSLEGNWFKALSKPRRGHKVLSA